ncbi:hypothetical protein HK100_009979 [Physocladia obscura]|uniref:Fatty acid hydroxylase domain-containing protein n=1 Tax=Physocladia obscura TaxID=109957 RepID=A0AAD5SN62_9FUNG|nr:hypothetical protein HK100_009979 [Physocladia obscura]
MQFETDLLRSAVGDHPAMLSWIIFMAIFYALSLFFEFCDRFGLFREQKHFRGTASSPTFERMLPTVLVNQFLILLPSMLVVSSLGGFNYVSPAYKFSNTTNMLLTGSSQGSPEWYHIGPISLLCTLLFAAAIHEILFYVGHRYILHSRFGYITLNHRLHHSSPTNCAISAFYMTPIDFALEILVPYYGSLGITVYLGLCQPIVAIALLPIGTIGGVYEHSGYNFWPGVPGLDTVVHYAHHSKHNCSFADGFGAPSVLDPWFGTACGSPATLLRAALKLNASADVAEKLNDIAIENFTPQVATKTRDWFGFMAASRKRINTKKISPGIRLTQTH